MLRQKTYHPSEEEVLETIIVRFAQLGGALDQFAINAGTTVAAFMVEQGCGTEFGYRVNNRQVDPENVLQHDDYVLAVPNVAGS